MKREFRRAKRREEKRREEKRRDEKRREEKRKAENLDLKAKNEIWEQNRVDKERMGGKLGSQEENM